MVSKGTPQKSGRIETQEAARNLARARTADVEEGPQNIYGFSFQIAQMMARNDEHNRSLPLAEQNPNFQPS